MNGGYRCSILKRIWILVTAGQVTKGVVAVFTYDKSHCVPGPHGVNRSLALSAPDSFGVRFTITDSMNYMQLVNKDVGSNQQDALGSFVLQLNRTWAPIGVDRFYQLILDNYYDCAAFFRVVPGFVAQFGIASEPNETAKWDFNIEDDPVIVQSNVRGTVSYATAGPGTRTTQLFINLVDNRRLDQMGFVPIGIIDTEAMNTVVPFIYNPTKDSDGIDQGDYEDYGNAWLLKEYPDVDLIVNATLLVEENAPPNAAATNATEDVEMNNRVSQQQQSHRFHGRSYDDNDNRQSF